MTWLLSGIAICSGMTMVIRNCNTFGHRWCISISISFKKVSGLISASFDLNTLGFRNPHIRSISVDRCIRIFCHSLSYTVGIRINSFKMYSILSQASACLNNSNALTLSVSFISTGWRMIPFLLLIN